MYYLVEDPTYLLAALVLTALGLLLALRVTQQGKYLIWAGLLAAMAAAVFGFERYWVTDAERIEAVVYDLADAVAASDVDRIRSHLDDRATFGTGGQTVDARLPLQGVLPYLRQTRFDFVRVTRLEANAGGQSRRGSAEFALTAAGVYEGGGTAHPLGTPATKWSLGFREASPGVWKVNRITALELPREVARIFSPFR